MSNDFKIHSKLSGDGEKTNDVIVFSSPKMNSKYNLIYFSGDVQDYPEEMAKHPINKSYVEWNLIDTGRLLINRFSELDNPVNVFIIKADSMYLKTFAKYSNFVPSNDFGSPIMDDESNDAIDALKHLNKLYTNIIQEGMQWATELPIVICGFSKGCVVLNQICRELLSFTLKNDDNQLNSFVNRLKHFIWLDGGHSGTSGAWLTENNVVINLFKLNVHLYIYATPYQISENNPKKWAIKEYKVFLDLLSKYSGGGSYKSKLYYLNEKNIYDEKNYEIEAHFKILRLFDCNLIENCRE